MLDDLTSSPKDLQVQSIVHGVIHLQKLHPEFGDERRRLNVVKVRGVKFLGGHHDYVIQRGGLKVFPRMVSANNMKKHISGKVLSELPEFDKLLGGGIDSGTSNLFMGPAGTGKSSLALQYAMAACNRGEHVAVYSFEESLQTLFTRTNSLGMNLEEHFKSGRLSVQKVDPAELSPGEFSSLIRDTVKNNNTRLVVIDSLNGYLHAMPAEQYLTLQLHELLSFLGNQGVTTIMVLAQQGLMGAIMNTPVDLTYLADTVIITRYFEAEGAVKKAVSVIKKRGGAHESTIREFAITKEGILVGQPLKQFQGVLTGVPSLLSRDQGRVLGEKDEPSSSRRS